MATQRCLSCHVSSDCCVQQTHSHMQARVHTLLLANLSFRQWAFLCAGLACRCAHASTYRLTTPSALVSSAGVSVGSCGGSESQMQTNTHGHTRGESKDGRTKNSGNKRPAGSDPHQRHTRRDITSSLPTVLEILDQCRSLGNDTLPGCYATDHDDT